METRQIRYFLAVAKWGSFSQAATRIGVAQPALSAQIAKLEARLGCALFVRKPRGVELTPAGLRFRKHALEIWDRIELAYQETRSAARRNGPELTIGIPTLTSSLLVAPLVEGARRHLPVTLRVREAMGASLRDMLAERQLDLAILYKVPGESYADATLLFEEPLYIGTRAELAPWRGDTLSAAQLGELPLVLSTSGNSHRRQLEHFAQGAGLQLNIVAEVDSINGQMELVLKGVGATVFPLSGFANWPGHNLRLAKIDCGGLLSQAYLVRSNEPKHPQTLAPVEDLLRAIVSSLIEGGSWPGARSRQPSIT